MPLDAEQGKTMLQLITSRYDDRHWRKKIEKTLGLPQSGVAEPTQQQIFMYLKLGLKAYKSRRADPDSWIIGGYAMNEVIDRAKFQPQLVGSDVTKDDVAFLGIDPGKQIDEDGKVFAETSNNGGCDTNISFNYTFDGSKLTLSDIGDPEKDASCTSGQGLPG